MGFLSECIAANSFIQHLVQLHKIRLFEKSFTLSLDAINDRNWSFHFFTSQIADDPIVCIATTSFVFHQFQPLNYFSVWVITCMSNSWIWGHVLGSVQVGTNKCVRVQKKAVKFAHHAGSLNSQTLTSHRKLSRICALFKVYSGEQVWKAIGDRLQWPHYLSRVDHERKIRSRRQRTDIGIYSFVNRTIQHWNQLSAEVLSSLPCKRIIFKKRVRKVIIKVS